MSSKNIWIGKAKTPFFKILNVLHGVCVCVQAREWRVQTAYMYKQADK